MESRPAISVVIPAYNEAKLLGATLDSVHACFATLGRVTCEIVVCDNNSTDQTAAIAQGKGARVVFESHNQIARARNAGARAALGLWLIFLDADTLMNPIVLRETVAAFESGRIAAGGSVLRMDSENLGWIARAFVALWTWISVKGRLAAGSYIFCTREAWVETGGFDEEVYASEEIWFSKKLKQWCRSRGLQFTIFSTAPVVTSARKVHWYGGREILWQMLLLAMPGALKQRSKCGLWYSRPVEENP